MQTFVSRFADVVAAALAVFAIYVAGFGVFDTIIVYGTTVLLGVVAGFLALADRSKDRDGSGEGDGRRGALATYLNVALMVVFVALVWRWSGIMLEQEEFFIDISRTDMALAWVAFALIGYLTWRHFGVPMAVVYFGIILFALAPHALGGAGLVWSSVADRQWFTTDGVFGRPVQVVSTVVLIFIVFGAILQASGAGAVLLKIAFSATGRFAGGPAHASILGSALFGTMSGAAVANVVSTGIFTIPIIKKAGFKPKFAGGVEAAASTGGQIMPPVMGVVAFIMADVTAIPYLLIVVAAILPALFYYFSLFLVVLIEARKQQVGATPRTEREPITSSDWLKSLAFWIPLAVIVGVLLTGRTPQKAGYYAMIVATVLCLGLFPEFRHPKKWWEALVHAGRTAGTLMIIVASVGVVIGIVNMTGIGLAFADAIRATSGGDLFFALVLVMIGCLVMGMGVPSVTAYLILALVMGPVLENLGIPKIAAHMFMVYFGVLSVVTPPVALAAFAAAPIAGAKPMETGFEAVRLSIAGFIIPFVFVYNPDILIIDSFTVSGLAWAILSFMAATWLIATGLARYEAAALAPWESVVRLLLAIALLTPDRLSTLVAGLLAVLLVGWHNYRHMQPKSLPSTDPGRTP